MVATGLDFSRSRDDVLAELVAPLAFRPDYPGDHINFWHLDRIRGTAAPLGFQQIILSKQGQSVAPLLAVAEADQACPEMSLYVDLIR